jgi:hypothetical protein
MVYPEGFGVCSEPINKNPTGAQCAGTARQQTVDDLLSGQIVALNARLQNLCRVRMTLSHYVLEMPVSAFRELNQLL